ncbi:hypothetical protein ACHAWF_014783 [Thalassiosira exigua]
MSGCGRDDDSSFRHDDCGAREGGIDELDHRSIKAISKGFVRTFQTVVQKNVRSQQMLPGNAPAPMLSVQAPLQKMTSEGSRIAMQSSAILDGVGDRLSMLRRSKSSFSMTRNNEERGIYSSESMKSWGRGVSAEISTFTSEKVVPFFRRSNTSPFPVGSSTKIHSTKEVSFDYQLMKDNE